jgi:hypothetical protein
MDEFVQIDNFSKIMPCLSNSNALT